MNATTATTPAPETAATYTCDNCGKTFDDLTPIEKIDDLRQRVEPNGPMPAGQCDECGALCYEDRAEASNDAIQITLVLPDSFCADVLCTALEGAIGYWSVADKIKRTKGADWSYLSAILTDAEEADDWTHKVDYAAIRRGIQRALEPDFNLNTTTKGAIFNGVTHLDAGQIDGDAADAIVQAACFNELVYG